jgi:hypothetical protein
MRREEDGEGRRRRLPKEEEGRRKELEPPELEKTA